jgi:hypothetical protein
MCKRLKVKDALPSRLSEFLGITSKFGDLIKKSSRNHKFINLETRGFLSFSFLLTSFHLQFMAEIGL